MCINNNNNNNVLVVLSGDLNWAKIEYKKRACNVHVEGGVWGLVMWIHFQYLLSFSSQTLNGRIQAIYRIQALMSFSNSPIIYILMGVWELILCIYTCLCRLNKH